MASAACCCCGSATGVGGAEVDGLGDVEDVAADVPARTFVALVAVVPRRVVLGVAGSLWGSGPGPFAAVQCRGAARAGYPPPPYSWGRVGLRSW